MADHNAPEYEVIYEDGHKSWCPQKQFEEANRLTTGMPFGLAIEAMKEGDALIDVSLKLGSVAKGARVIHGIIRVDSKNSPKYVTIASGLNIDKIFNKLKVKATDSAVKHIDKIKTKATKKLEAKEDRLLNV
jgi:hypothetical protein